MRIHLKQAVSFHGKDYKLGVHELPESVLKDPYFHKLVLAGLAFEEEDVKHISVESLHEKSKKLAEKLMGSVKAEHKEEQVLSAEAEMEEQIAKDEKPTQPKKKR